MVTRFLVVLTVTAVPLLAVAQTHPDPSPLAPGDLKAPIFDTTRPVYDPATGQDRSASTIVAEVDGRAVTLGEVGEAVRGLPQRMASLPFSELFPNVVGQLVREQALVIRAQHARLDDDPQIRLRLKAATDRVLADEVLQRESAASITEQALLDRYHAEIAGKPGPEEVLLRVIMEPTETAATAAIAKLDGGADFALLAKDVSQDSTASVGGDLGYQTRDSLTAEIGAVAFALRAGTYAPFPVRSGNAWFVIKVEARRQEGPPAFSVAHDMLEQELIRERAPQVVEKAMAGVTIHEYSITGKETAELQGVKAGDTVK